MLRTGRLPAPHRGRSSPASTPGSRPTPGVLLPGTLASPRTGLPPAGCRELVARLRRGALLSVVLGARAGWTHIPRESAGHRAAQQGLTARDAGVCLADLTDRSTAVRATGLGKKGGPPDRSRAAPQ